MPSKQVEIHYFKKLEIKFATLPLLVMDTRRVGLGLASLAPYKYFFTTTLEYFYPTSFREPIFVCLLDLNEKKSNGNVFSPRGRIFSSTQMLQLLIWAPKFCIWAPFRRIHQLSEAFVIKDDTIHSKWQNKSTKPQLRPLGTISFISISDF